MFIKEGVKQVMNNQVDFSFNGILTFLDKQLDKEKKLDFLNRKFKPKDIDNIVVVSIDSLSPLRLVIRETYDYKNMSDELKVNNDIFDPLFGGKNVTNGQYRKVEVTSSKEVEPLKNSGSFSDFYLSGKTSSKVFPLDGSSLTTGMVPESQPLKNTIVDEFYRLLNQWAPQKEKEVTEFIIDFNSLIEIDATEKEKERFLQNLFDEKEVQYKVDYVEWKEKRNINKGVYLLESVEFQCDIFQTVLTGKDIDKVLDERIKLRFEVPTGEKPLLSHNRLKENPKEEDIPRTSFGEMVLLRLMVVDINKQGDTVSSGYYFPLKEGDDKYSTLERNLQIVSDKNGNMSIRYMDVKDREKDKELYWNIRHKLQTIFAEKNADDYSNKELFARAHAKFIMVKEELCRRYPKEKERLDDLWGKAEYKKLSKVLHDGVYQNIEKRAVLISDKEKQSSRRLLLDVLFLMKVLNRQMERKLERMSFLTTNLNPFELCKKEHLTKEEWYYLLGNISGAVVKGSRNESSVSRNMLGQRRGHEILKLINKRFESGMDEISYINEVNRRMKKVLEEKVNLEVDVSQTMTSEEKFAYVTGYLSELNYNKKAADKGENK